MNRLRKNSVHFNDCNNINYLQLIRDMHGLTFERKRNNGDYAKFHYVESFLSKKDLLWVGIVWKSREVYD